MTPENFGSHFEHQEQIKLKIATPEDIKKVEQNIEYSKKLVRANNVLQVLDFPDNQEDGYRKLLLSQDNKTLEELAKVSKEEVLSFLVQIKNRKIETKKSALENIEMQGDIKAERIERKIEKIRAVFPTSILDSNPDIAEKFNALDTMEDPSEKEAVLKEMLQLLKSPGRLKAITDELG